MTGSEGRPTTALFRHRLAAPADVPALTELACAAIVELQRDYLSAAQIAASQSIMGIDTQLIADRTYYVVEYAATAAAATATVAGCGGWSRRATLYGGDHTSGRNDALLDPATDPARVRAMYTDPRFARRGVGRLVLSLCEAAAAAEGFRTLELMATMAGVPLYTAYGFTPVEHVEDTSTGMSVPLVRMAKTIGE